MECLLHVNKEHVICLNQKLKVKPLLAPSGRNFKCSLETVMEMSHVLQLHSNCLPAAASGFLKLQLKSILSLFTMSMP